jgi:hypothetical protein
MVRKARNRISASMPMDRAEGSRHGVAAKAFSRAGASASPAFCSVMARSGGQISTTT